MYKNYNQEELKKELEFFLEELKLLEEKERNIKLNVELIHNELKKRNDLNE